MNKSKMAIKPEDVAATISTQADVTLTAAQKRAEHYLKTWQTHAESISDRSKKIADIFGVLGHANGNGRGIIDAWTEYLTDRAQRSVLFADAMRQFSDTVIQHNAEGAPPVLIFDSELVMDGKDLDRPCNYFLLRLLPSDGAKIDNTKRPIVIVDPRAGHGGGIGGFKPDSQVGVAFKRGHPVYFVAFHQEPIPHQTLAMVADAEAAFLREIERLHPKSPKPVVVGNCQGGWATAILAATNPDLTGPIVLNGAPMSYWAGKVGQDLMRYSGGLVGGALPAMVAGDVSGGIFDGADLVLNFEGLNPARNWFGKYFDLYQNVDTGVDRFLKFERWWGGFYLLTTEEITWIVENLFVGNKLPKNTAQLEPGRPIDLKNIKAPIICFASHGDNITPPAQALDWIMDCYATEEEIQIRGQKILYMLHDQIGHLGIFVSASIANRETSEMADVLEIIEALPPGLYEMKVEAYKGEGDDKTFDLSISAATFDDIIAATGERTEEPAFAAVARGSEALTEVYESTLRPFIVNSANEELGRKIRDLHPMRVSRQMFASDRPYMKSIEKQADAVRAERSPVSEDNPFRQMESLWGEMVETAWDSYRDIRETMIEMTFLNTYLSPWAMLYASKRNQERANPSPEQMGKMPEVQASLRHMAHGDLNTALVRTMILVSQMTPSVHLSNLSKALEELSRRKYFDTLSAEALQELIREQTIICKFDQEGALKTLPGLLKSDQEITQVLDAIDLVFGEQANVPAVVFEKSREIREMLKAKSKSTAPAKNPKVIEPVPVKTAQAKPLQPKAAAKTKTPVPGE